MPTPGEAGYTLAPGPEWTSLAANWQWRAVARETEPGHVLVDARHLERDGQPLQQIHLVCAAPGCGQSVCCLSPDAAKDGYLMDAAMLLTNVMIHIRHCHEPQNMA